jgi:hypothetical protein
VSSLAAAPERASFVLLRADTLRLVLPQQDVGLAEYMEGEPLPTGEPGLFEYAVGGACRIVAALSPALRTLEVFPGGRFVLTTLQADGAELCLAWDEVRVLIDAQLQSQPLPPALRTRGGPIQGYAEHAGQLLLCTTAQRLLAYAVGAGE